MEKAKMEAWFQWVELVQFSMEFSAGIQTVALGRKFPNCHDVLPCEAEQAAMPSSAAASNDRSNGGRLAVVATVATETAASSASSRPL